MREHQRPHPIRVDRVPVIGAIQVFGGQPQVNGPAARFGQCVSAVLHQFEQLPVRITPSNGVLFLVGVLSDEIRLTPVCLQGLLKFLPDIATDDSIRPRPTGWPKPLLRQLQPPVFWDIDVSS